MYPPRGGAELRPCAGACPVSDSRAVRCCLSAHAARTQRWTPPRDQRHRSHRQAAPVASAVLGHVGDVSRLAAPGLDGQLVRHRRETRIERLRLQSLPSRAVVEPAWPSGHVHHRPSAASLPPPPPLRRPGEANPARLDPPSAQLVVVTVCRSLQVQDRPSASPAGSASACVQGQMHQPCLHRVPSVVPLNDASGVARDPRSHRHSRPILRACVCLLIDHVRPAVRHDHHDAHRGHHDAHRGRHDARRGHHDARLVHPRELVAGAH